MRGRLMLLVLALAAMGGCASADRPNDKAAGKQRSEGRAIYSPDIKSDPYLQAQWDASARSLEAECARSGRYCKEAKAARTAISKLPNVKRGR
jgi:ABC-type sugar transport system substrate-binding protein